MSDHLQNSKDSVKDKAPSRLKRFALEKDLTLKQIERLINAFTEATKAKGGLTFDDFVKVFEKCYTSDFESLETPGVSNAELQKLYMEMDVTGKNMLSWEEFTTTLILKTEAQQEAELHAARVLEQDEKQHKLKTEHQQEISLLRYIEPMKRYISASRDGQISIYSEAFRLQRTLWNLSPLQKHALLKRSVYAGKQPQHTPWTLDVIYLTDCSKILCACDNGILQVYDFQTLERRCSLVLRNSSAMCLDYYFDQNTKEATKLSTIVMGTDSGELALYTFDANQLFAAAASFVSDEKLPSYELHQLPPGTGTFSAIEVHNQPVEQVCVFASVNSHPMVISVSLDSKASLCMLTLHDSEWRLQKTAAVNKGISCFAAMPRTSTLITGGLDHALRIWNVHQIESPLATLEGHSAPISHISLGQTLGTAISYSNDGWLCVWDAINHVALQKVNTNYFHETFSYVTFLKDSVFLCSKSIARLVWKDNSSSTQKYKQKSSASNTHNASVVAVIYNPVFGELITGCIDGEISIWDVNSGEKLFHFYNEQKSILSMSLDFNGRRLLVGSSNSEAYLYNFNNGQLLHKMRAHGSFDITCLAQIDTGDVKKWAVAGWSREIALFNENDDEQLWLPCTKIPNKRVSSKKDLRWHKDDIVGLAFTLPNILVSCSFEGTICLSNISNGDILAVISQDTVSKPLRSVPMTQLLFFHSRANSRFGAHLVTAGIDGALYFWNIFDCSTIHRFEIPHKGKITEIQTIASLQSFENDLVLATGNEIGTIQLWDISELMVNANVNFSSVKIPCLRTIKAHQGSVNSILLINKKSQNYVISAGSDCRVALYNSNGAKCGVLVSENSNWNFGSETNNTSSAVGEKSSFSDISEQTMEISDPKSSKNADLGSNFEATITNGKSDLELDKVDQFNERRASRSNLKTADYLSREFYKSNFTEFSWTREQYYKVENKNHFAVPSKHPGFDALNACNPSSEQPLNKHLELKGPFGTKNAGLQSVYKDVLITPLAPEQPVNKPGIISTKSISAAKTSGSGNKLKYQN